MAIRRKNLKAEEAFLFIIVLFVISYIFQFTSKYINEIKIATITFVAIYISIKILRFLRKKIIIRSISEAAFDIVTIHLKSLAKKKLQTVRKDDYGNLKTDNYRDEILYFMKSQIEYKLTPKQQLYYPKIKSKIFEMIVRRVEIFDAQNPQNIKFSNQMSPGDYEIFCAEELINSGWEARVTPTGADQGVDIIAEKSNIKVILQCKLYSRPVGNKAVQEAAAARAHERADFAVVVTNNKFTPAAEKLANTNDVLLLHHSELSDLSEKLK